MKVTNRTRTIHTHTLTLDDDTDVDLEFAPVDYHDPLVAHVGDKLVVAYLVHDSDCDNPVESCDGMGKIVGRGKYETRNHDESELFEALGLNRYGDPDYDKVEDALQQAWCEYVEAQDADFWSAVLDELGYPVPNRDNDDEMDAAREYMNALRDELLSVNIASEGSAYYALCRADDYITTYGFNHTQARNAASLFQFDVEKVQHDLWLQGLQSGEIGDRDGVMLDVYDHSGLHWSITGGGMQCRWDTSSGAGIWLPDEFARDEIDRRAQVYAHYLVRKTPLRMHGKDNEYQLLKVDWSGADEPVLNSMRFSDDWLSLWNQAATLAGPLNATPKQTLWARRQAAEELAQQALDEYNAWLSGDCYGCVVETFQNVGTEDEPSWEQINQDSCWGFVGGDYAKEELKDQFYDGAVADLQADALAVE